MVKPPRWRALSRSDAEAVLPPRNDFAGRRLQKCRFAGTLGDGPGWIRTSGLGIKSPLLCQLSYRPREKRRRLRRAADDGQAPRLAGREQLVRVDLAEPA